MFLQLALKDAEKVVTIQSNSPKPYLLKAYALILVTLWSFIFVFFWYILASLFFFWYILASLLFYGFSTFMFTPG